MIRELMRAMEEPKPAPWKKGTRVRMTRWDHTHIAGVVVAPVIAQAINLVFRIGPFVIIGGTGDSYSYRDQADAASCGWAVDWRPR